MSNNLVNSVKLTTLKLLEFFSDYGVSMLGEYQVPSDYNRKHHGYICMEDDHIYYDDEPYNYIFTCHTAKLCSNELFPFLCMLYNLGTKIEYFDTLFDKDTIMNIFILNQKCNFEKLYSKLFMLLRNRKFYNELYYLNIDTLEINKIEHSPQSINHILRIYSNEVENYMTEISIILSHDENVISQLFQSPFNSVIVNKILTNKSSKFYEEKYEIQKETIKPLYFTDFCFDNIDVENIFCEELLKKKLENKDYLTNFCDDTVVEKKINTWIKISNNEFHNCPLCGDIVFKKSIFDWTLYKVPNLQSRKNNLNDSEIIICTKCKSLIGVLHPIEYFIINNYPVSEELLNNLNISQEDYINCYKNMIKCNDYRNRLKNIVYYSKSSIIKMLISKYFNTLNFVSSMEQRRKIMEEIEILIPRIIEM